MPVRVSVPVPELGAGDTVPAPPFDPARATLPMMLEIEPPTRSVDMASMRATIPMALELPKDLEAMFAETGDTAVRVEGVRLDAVEAFEGMPRPVHEMLADKAEVVQLGPDEEVSGFGAALLLSGMATLCATIVDAAAHWARPGELLVSKGSLSEGIAVRIIGGAGGTVAGRGVGTGAAIGVIDAAFSFEAGAGDEAAFTARGAIDEPLGFDAGEPLGIETGVPLGFDAGVPLGFETGVPLGFAGGGALTAVFVAGGEALEIFPGVAGAGVFGGAVETGPVEIFPVIGRGMVGAPARGKSVGRRCAGSDVFASEALPSLGFALAAGASPVGDSGASGESVVSPASADTDAGSETIEPGALVFPELGAGGGEAPASARAGAQGALLLVAERDAAQRMAGRVPDLAARLRGA